MLVSGIIDLVMYTRMSSLMFGAGWLLFDGIISILLSLFLFFNEYASTTVIPLIFGMWVLFTGIEKMVSSFDLKKFGVTGWGWFTALGILLIIFGLLFFFKPLAAVVTISVFVGISFLLEGIVAIAKALFSNRMMM